MSGYEITDDDVRRAKAVAWKHLSAAPHLRDEYESAAMFGLAQAHRKFDPGRGLAFWTLAGRRVTGAIQDAARNALPLGFRRPTRADVSHAKRPEPLPVDVRRLRRFRHAKPKLKPEPRDEVAPTISSLDGLRETQRFEPAAPVPCFDEA